MFTPLKSLLPRAAHKHNIHRQITALHVCEKYRQIAESVLGDEVAPQTAPRFYKDKILIVGSANSTIAQEIFLHKDNLIKALNQALGENRIADIKTTIGS